MRALALALLMAIGLGAVADAQTAAPPHGRIENPTIDPARVPGDEPVVDPDRGSRRPSGYWTGYRPAQHGAYRWPLMGVGAVVLAITIALLVRYLRKVGGARAGATS